MAFLHVALVAIAIGFPACGDDDDGMGGNGATGGGAAGGGGALPSGGGGEGAAGGGGVGCIACSNGFECGSSADCVSLFCDGGTCAPCLSNDDCADAGVAWLCLTGVCTDGGPKDEGEACSAATDCASDNCVDGVCCDTACGGGDLDDCSACSEAAGAFSDGVCGPRVSGSACGDSADSECDGADTCDGAGSCDQHIRPAGAACTFDGMFCNGVDGCDGSGACENQAPPCDLTDQCDEAGAVCRANVWINEIHYDNADPDVDEGFEFAGPAGLDATNFSVLLYEGASGTLLGGAPIGGVFVDESNGFGTLSFPNPDTPEGNMGLVIIDEAGLVLQFLSYGGAFTAADGPAAGMTSVDVGLTESEATVGTSIQLTGGPGSQSSDFTWTTGPSSLGAVNAGQSF